MILKSLQETHFLKEQEITYKSRWFAKYCLVILVLWFLLLVSPWSSALDMLTNYLNEYLNILLKRFILEKDLHIHVFTTMLETSCL